MKKSLLFLAVILTSPVVLAAPVIVLPENPSQVERYAAAELQRYLRIASGEQVAIAPENGEQGSPRFVLTRGNDAPGNDGYTLKRTGTTLTIRGRTPEALLYGVYGLLGDHYGFTFLMSGDIAPPKSPLRLPDVDETRTPRQAVRGFTNHWCYMQGAGTWSLQDWKSHIDRMARMRMNLLSVHDYIFEGYRELWLNWGNFSQKNLNQHSGRGAFYHWCSWPLAEYPGRAADLFDDYAFGSALSLHSGSLSNRDQWARCAATFREIIAYAHRRGVKIALGTEFHHMPPAGRKEVAESIIKEYPDLDYLVYYRHENTANPPFCRDMYDLFKRSAPKIRHVLTGWGPLGGNNLKDVPKDVVAGPFTAYKDEFENGSLYGDREYWAGPWLEEDNKGDMHYMPVSKNLNRTVASYRKAAPNMNGLVTLTWRLTDAIDPRLCYVAEAPWVAENRFPTSRAVYLDYARRCYGVKNAETIAAILDQNEAAPVDASDCRVGAGNTQGMSPVPNPVQQRKAAEQVAVLDRCLQSTDTPEQAERLRWLRQRILGAELHIEMAGKPEERWDEAFATAEAWTRSYLARSIDMSTLGQLVSNQQMIMQYCLVNAENHLRAKAKVKFPSRLVVRRTGEGLAFAWRNEERGAKGFNLYRNGVRLNREPLTGCAFSWKTDDVSGSFAATAIAANGTESRPCIAATADTAAPRVIVVSPPTTAIAGLPLDIEARVDTGFAPEYIRTTLRWRRPGDTSWNEIPMIRRCRSVFAARIPAEVVAVAGLECRVTATIAGTEAVWPSTLPGGVYSITVEAAPVTTPLPPSPPVAAPDADGRTLRWNAPGAAIRWFRIYRGTSVGFKAGPENFVTALASSTHAFRDLEPDFDGSPLRGARFYRIVAVDAAGRESAPSRDIPVTYGN